MTIIQLSQSQSTFTAIAQDKVKGLGEEDAKAMLATLTVLLTGTPADIYFLVESQTIIPNESSKPDQECSYFLGELAQTAHSAAVALQCSSILGGRASESDDYSDVAFWAGSIDESRQEEGILQALGLSGLLEMGEIIPIEDDGKFPLFSLNSIQNDDVAALKEQPGLSALLGKLSASFEFRVELPDNKDDVILHFYAGKWNGVWCGLVGASVQPE